MIIKGKEAILANVSISLKKSILETRNISCECSNTVTCWRCNLLKTLRETKEMVDYEILRVCL